MIDSSKYIKAVFVCLLLFFRLVVLSQPGKNGNYTVTTAGQVLNKYAPVSQSISVGSSTVAVANPSLLSLCPGDLIMVYQAQGATISTTNSVQYGTITSYGSAGLYEFQYVLSINGNTITTQSTFTNSYFLSGRPQVIKVPQYQTLTINSGASIVAKSWIDTSIAATPYRFGGLCVLHALNIVNNGTISANEAGFRGGSLHNNTSWVYSVYSYVSALTTVGGVKGEGIAGDETDYINIGGKYCRGAPANGGGGGNSVNSGGGGGANGFNGNLWTGQGYMISNTANPLSAWTLDTSYIANGNALTSSSGGGRGGYSWGDNNGDATTAGPTNTVWAGDLRRQIGGMGGHPLTNINAESRIYFGGGGGSAHQNNSASPAGGNGGGIVYLVSTSTISGNGLITSDGKSVGNSVGCSCDGMSGGGAGGSIIIKTSIIVASQTISARGGAGGIQLAPSSPATTTENEGPGGGGGGGYIAISATAGSQLTAGGFNGYSLSPALTEFPFNGATEGAPGQLGSVSQNFVTFQPITNVTVSSNSPLCAGLTLSLTANPSGATSYSWSGPSFTSSVQNPTVGNTNPGVSGIYSVSVNNSGCITGNTVQIVVVPQLTLSALSTSAQCHNGSGSATVTVMGGIGPPTYSWLPISATTAVVANLNSGVYTITANDAIAGCITTGTVFVSQPNPSTLTIAPSSPTLCAGNTVTLTAINSGGTPGYNYFWDSGANSPTTSVTPVTPGSYSYSVNSFDQNNCQTSASIVVVVFANPTLNVASFSICAFQTTTLNVFGAANYTWLPTGTTGAQLIVAPGSQQSYTVFGTSSQGCGASAIATLSIISGPTLSFNTTTINCANLGTGTVVAPPGSGPYSFTWMPTSQVGSVATGLYPGNYTISVFDASVGCTFTQTTYFSPLVPLTGSVSATPSISCHSVPTGTANISLAGGSGTQNYIWTDALGTQTTASVYSLAAGINTVFVSDALTHCTLTQTFLITQPPALTLTISSSSNSVCLGNSIVLTASGSGGVPGYTYTWTSQSSSNSFTATELSAGTYTYEVVSFDQNHCVQQKTIQVSFVPNPTITIATQPTVCPLESTLLHAVGGSSYQWSTGFLGNPLSITPSANISYTVVGSALGCTNSAIGFVYVKPSPSANFSILKNQICEGDSASFFHQNIQSSYFWSGPQSFTSTSQNITLYSCTPLASGVYTLKTTAANGCTASTTQSLLVNPKPVLTVSGSTVCEGQNITLNCNFQQSGLYYWTGPNSFTSTVQNPLIASSTSGMSGSYNLSVVSTLGCTNTSVANVSVIPLPVPVINVPNSFCQGSTIHLQGSGGQSMEWFGPASFYSTQQNPSIVNSTILHSGTYSLIVHSGICSNRTSIYITVNSLPNISVTYSPVSCEGYQVAFNAQGAYNYTWNGPNNYSYTGSNAIIPSAELNSSGFYTLVAQDTNGCASQSLIPLTILASPKPVTAESSFCIGGTATLSADGGQSYLWIGPANFSSTLSSVYFFNTTADQIGTYTLTVFGSNSCSTTTLVLLEGLNLALPTPSILSSGKACEGDQKVLTGLGGESYYWLCPNNKKSQQQTLVVPPSDLQSGDIYTLVATNSLNCTNSTTIEINIYPKPKGKILATSGISCIPFCTTLQTTTDSAVKNIHYVFNTYDYKTTRFSHCFDKAGSYPIHCFFTDTNECIGTASLVIQAYDKPKATFILSPSKPIAGIDAIQVQNTSTPTSHEPTWLFDGTSMDTLHSMHPTIQFDTPGVFPVVLIVKDAHGCSDTAIQKIEVLPYFSFYMPNVFTPNSDGLNDLFLPKSVGVSTYYLAIYNRWGEKVFESDQVVNGWNGTYQGVSCKNDIYTWIVDLKTSVGERKTFKGFVTLLRRENPSD